VLSKVAFEDDTKKAYKIFSQYLVKVPVHYISFVLERTESWTNRKTTSFAMIVLAVVSPLLAAVPCYNFGKTCTMPSSMFARSCNRALQPGEGIRLLERS
jgi:hypothetical protein